MFQGTIAEDHCNVQMHDAVQSKIVEFNSNFEEHCGKEFKFNLNAKHANVMFILIWADLIWDINDCLAR